MEDGNAKGLTVLEVLEKARALIADKKRWTQREFARNRRSETVSPDDPEACRWCAAGAVMRVLGLAESDLYDDSAALSTHNAALAALELHARIGGYNVSVADVNDSLGWAAAMNLYDRAIAAEKAKAVAQ